MPMKTIQLSNTLKKLFLCLIALPVLLLAGCDQRKADIENKKDVTVDRLDQQIEAIDDAAASSKTQADNTATVKKAIIEANRETVTAQLEADKVKATAKADADKARVDADEE